MQGDINQVNKIAHTIKARLEKLDGDNAKALNQKVRCSTFLCPPRFVAAKCV